VHTFYSNLIVKPEDIIFKNMNSTVLEYFMIGLPWELLYVDDRVLIVDSIEEAMVKFKKWWKEVESKVSV